MRCVSCNQRILNLSYKQYREKDPKTGKITIIKTDILEDLCGNCISQVYDSEEETVDLHSDLSIGLDLPFSDNNY